MNFTLRGSSRVPWIGLAVGWALCLLACPGQAQTYTLDWFTVDGGGGASAGGIYTVSGTIGQPDAGPLSGGIYKLEGGFWAATAGAPIAEPTPELDIFLTDTNTVVVYWSGPATGWRLQVATSIPPSAGAWIDIAPPYQTQGSRIYHVETTARPQTFYRLIKP